MIDSFIPVDLAVAPNPLGLPSNLKLITIPVDAYTCFELWIPAAQRLLLPEEALLLRGDRPRLESICTKLTDLLGATLLSADTPLLQSPTYQWQDIRRELDQAGADFDAIAVAYLPQVIYPCLGSSGRLAAWTMQQSGWSISFLALKPTLTGFRSEVLPIKVSIAFGQSMTRFVKPATVAASHA